MRTKYGEITIGKIIISLFLITLATLVFSSGWSDGDEFGEVLNLPIKDYFIGFSLYIVWIIIITIRHSYNLFLYWHK